MGKRAKYVSETISGELPNPFSRSAETGRPLGLADHSRLGHRLVARDPAVASAQPADAPLDVANALKPIAAIIRAEPPSHTFAMTKAPGGLVQGAELFGLVRLAHPLPSRVSFIEKVVRLGRQKILGRVRTGSCVTSAA